MVGNGVTRKKRNASAGRFDMLVRFRMITRPVNGQGYRSRVLCELSGGDPWKRITSMSLNGRLQVVADGNIFV